MDDLSDPEVELAHSDVYRLYLNQILFQPFSVLLIDSLDYFNIVVHLTQLSCVHVRREKSFLEVLLADGSHWTEEGDQVDGLSFSLLFREG